MRTFMAVCAAAATVAGAVGAPPSTTAGGVSPTVESPTTWAPPGDHPHPSLLSPSTIAAPPAETVISKEPAAETPSTPNTWDGPEWSIYADAVYLQPRWPDLEVGIANRRNLGVPNGAVERVEFDPAVGVRVGFGRRWSCDSGFRLENTFLAADSHGNTYRRPGATVTPTLTHPIGLRDLDAGLGTGRHESNVLDLLWMRRIHSADCFDLWLEGGPRAAWLSREFNVAYVGGDAAPLASMDHDLDFRGYGLSGGLAGQWKLGGGWAVDAGGRLSLLASRNKLSVFETSRRGAALLADATDTRTDFTPMLDFHAGLSRTAGAFTVMVGYQMQQWFGVSELLTFGDDVHVGSLNRRRGDFGMDGLFVRLGVSF